MISLTKGQAVSLEKNGAPLTRIAMGTGWDGVKKGIFGRAVDIDLDASALVYSQGKLIDQIWFQQLESMDRLIKHSGDNRTGDGDGDDETISVDLSRLSTRIDAIVFTVNSFSGQSFSDVKSAYTRLVDLSTGTEVARFSLTDAGAHTGMIMAIVSRSGSGWEVKAIGERASGRTFRDMAPQIQALLR